MEKYVPIRDRIEIISCASDRNFYSIGIFEENFSCFLLAFRFLNMSMQEYDQLVISYLGPNYKLNQKHLYGQPFFTLKQAEEFIDKILLPIIDEIDKTNEIERNRIIEEFNNQSKVVKFIKKFF